MPLYEYHCNHCDKTTEALQKFSDEPLTNCPHCHESSLHKVISQTAFQLKGDGWYVTDFKDKKTKTDTSAKETAPPAPKTEAS